jgi:hypothetical protein
MQPWYDMTLEILHKGIIAGLVRSDISEAKLAELIMRVTVSTAHSQMLGSHTDSDPINANDAWQFCLGGIRQAGD